METLNLTKYRASLLLTILVTIGTSSLAQAYDFDSNRFSSRRRGGSLSSFGRDEGSTQSLSIAGGIASPSSTGFFGENPTGLIFNQHASLLAYLATGKDDPSLLSNGFSFLGGNGLAAAMIGVQTYNNATDAGGSITHFNFGMATFAEAINVAFGLSGSYRFQTGSNAVDPALAPTWTADLGILYNPFGGFQVGAMLYGLSEGVTAAGAGIAAHINTYSLFAFDVSADRHGRGLTVKPGLGVRAGSLNLTYAYGMQVDKSALSGITPGNTIGLGYDFTPQFRVIGYYNHFATYYMGATIDLF